MNEALTTALVAVIGMVGCFLLGFCAGVVYKIDQDIKDTLKNIGKEEKK